MVQVTDGSRTNDVALCIAWMLWRTGIIMVSTLLGLAKANWGAWQKEKGKF